MLSASSPWPAVTHEEAHWTSPDGRASGTFGQAVVPSLADAELVLSPGTAALVAEATEHLQAFTEAMSAPRLQIAAPALLHVEAVASSQIEGITAGTRSIFAAELGSTDRANATLIARNSAAMRQAIANKGGTTSELILDLHRTLLADEEDQTPGHFRREPVWIGAGASSTPLDATYVAPAWETVPDLIDDLAAFTRRAAPDRVVAAAAVAHAQFVAIHPFTDGNGRTGRALIHAELRRAGSATSAVVPLSAGILAAQARYVSAITAYQAGDPEPMVRVVAAAVIIAIPRALALASSITDLRESWASRAGASQDFDSVRLLDLVAGRPVVDVGLVSRELGIEPERAREVLDELAGHGTLTAHLPRHRGISTWRSTEAIEILGQFSTGSERQ